MMLSDAGAEVLAIDRADRVGKETTFPVSTDVMARGRRNLGLNLKSDAGREVALRLVEGADALFEGFRPGVMERLGLGPDLCLERNARLVYGRMTGWGQEGPIAHSAGHDINYIALAGALHPVGRPGAPPTPPLNLFGDFGGGGMLLAYGVVCALLEAQRSGKGQVVDAAMVDGAAALMAMIYGGHAAGWWKDERASNFIDGGSHFYDSYETKDGKFIAIGSIEPQFYAELLEKSGLGEEMNLPKQNDRTRWPEMKERVAAIFRSKTREEWCALMEGSDVCFAPVLSLAEAPRHPHNRARETFVEIDGTVHPAPAPRFSRTPSTIASAPVAVCAHTPEVLADWGFEAAELTRLKDEGAIA